MQWDIGLEFSETSVRMAIRGRGVVMNMPSAVAMRSGEVLAVGAEALAMLGRTPAGVTMKRPLRSGRMAEPSLVRLWMESALKQYAGRLKRPTVLMLVPAEMPETDRTMLKDIALNADAARCGFMDSGMAAALGAGANVLKPEGVLAMDAGAGTIGAALISYARVVARQSLPYGMARIDQNIVMLLRDQLALSIGPRTAEELKIQLGSAIPGRELNAEAVGIDMTTGFPGAKTVDAELIRRAAMPVIEAMAELAVSVAGRASGELAADLAAGGMVLTGGGALMYGLSQLVAERVGIPCRVPNDAAGCSLAGLMRAMEWEEYAQLVIQ